MQIRADELDRIAIDRCVSTSGAFESVLCSRYEPGDGGLVGFYIVNLVAGSRRVRQIVRIAIDNPTVASVLWEDWKNRFAGKNEEAVYEDEIPSGLTPLRFSPPIFIKEDLFVLKLKPKGGYMFVRDITPITEVEQRAQQSNLELVLAEENKPRPSMAIIINLGPDPLLHEEFTVGDIVMFRTHAGGTFNEANYEYRYLQHHEIIGSRSPDDGLDDMLPANITPEMIQWAKDLKRTLDEVAAREPVVPITSKMLDGAVIPVDSMDSKYHGPLGPGAVGGE